MKKSFLDCRLLHIDYDKHLCGKEKEKAEQDSKNKLLSEFIESFALTNAIVKDNKIVSDKEIWYFSTTHAKGTTMVYFAKWPSGISCIATVDLISDWSELVKDYSDQEKQWLSQNNNKESFAKLQCAKKALYKCYFNTYGKDINFNEWNLQAKNRQFIYSKNKEEFVSSQGTSDEQYIFFICEKE